MTTTTRLVMLVLTLAACGCARAPDSQRWPSGTLVDLSHDYSEQTVFWPRSSLKVGGLEDMLTAMTMASLEWLGQNASTPASQKRPRKAATKRTS